MKLSGLKIVKRQLPENFEDIDDDEEMVDEDEMSDELMREYVDEEVYVAVIEHSYGIILSEKKNIEKALKKTLPNSLMLKEWYEKNQELFNEVKKEENGGMNSNEAGFNGHRNEGEADGGNEEGFSPVRGLVVHGDMHDDGGGFNTPNMEKVDNTNNLTCSQFLEQPEVLATTIKMTDDDVLESYKKEKKNEILEIVEVCEEDDGNGKMGKREKKNPVYGKSPFVERIVKIGGKVKKDEMTLYNSVFVSKIDYGEEIWNIGSDHVLHQGFVYHFKSNTFIHAIIIDFWTYYSTKWRN
ncbi:unnamed protein product [Lactuca saligna]|uniref:Uncharacterized protein n=1 Tax=Lactuca saligna TaxID=75948 RepID=A0AA35YNA1_LACSI|nr:unnamed protein product [Lactuca saligna]